MPGKDGHRVDLTLFDSAGADLLEYELEYETGNMIQGAIGRIDFTSETLPVSKELLFGSCSAGKCKYDEDVSGGSLTLRFEGGQEFALKGDFTLFSMTEAEGVFSSRNSRVALDVGPKGLENDSFMLVFDTLGLPGEISQEVVDGPYGFFSSSAEAAGQFSLAWQTKEDPAELKVFGWVDDQWQEYSQNRAVDDGRLTVSVDQATTFVLVK